jgi:dolichol kinase
MFLGETQGLIYSYLYAIGILILGEVLYRKLDVPQFYTRKFVHIWAGMWVFGIIILFYRWEVGIIPFATFIVINFILYRYRLSRAIDAPDSTPGTVYFALAITVLFALLWRPIEAPDRGPIATAGIMALTWGDALAAIVGKSVGRHRYRIAGTERSWEGTIVMFAASFVAILLTLALLPGSQLAPFARQLPIAQTLIATLLGATAATIAESVTPRGLDNLTIPFAAAGALLLATSL